MPLENLMITVAAALAAQLTCLLMLKPTELFSILAVSSLREKLNL